jgi:DNA repair protein RadC
METYHIPQVRLQMVKEKEVPFGSYKTSQDVADALYRQELGHADREVFVAIHLNTKNVPVSQEIVSIGGLNHALIYPREVFKGAVMANAAAIIIAHNHPSSNVNPSKEDDQVTRRLAAVGKILGIKLLDHIILSPTGKYYSYNDEDSPLLEPKENWNIPITISDRKGTP